MSGPLFEKLKKILVAFVASGIHPQEHLFLFFCVEKWGLFTFLPKPPAIVGEQAHGTDASGNITGSSVFSPGRT